MTTTDPRAVLQKCAETFREYERLHSIKGTPDADMKALRNRAMAEMCEASLARHREQAACEGVDREPGQAVSDREAVEIWRLIEVLTDGEGDTVTVLCPNPDFNGQPNYAIECNGYWTNWQDRRFADDKQVECFRKAVAALATLPKPEQPLVEASEQGEVTQEDRDAAANFVKAWDAKYGEGINDFGPSEVDSVWLRSGDHDGELIIQAMKRHRLTAIRTLEAEVEDLRQLDVILREMLGEQQAYAAAAEAAVTHWQDKFAAATLQREEVEAKLAEAREVMIAVRARFQPLRLTPNTKAVMDRVNAFLSPKEPS